MFSLTVLSAPKGLSFRFEVGEGKLRIVNTKFPTQPWSIDIPNPIDPGSAVIRLSNQELALRLEADLNSVLSIVITGLISKPVTWKVSLKDFNDHLYEVQAVSTALQDYLYARKEYKGDRFVDEGLE